jgi:hypothetical protein
MDGHTKRDRKGRWRLSTVWAALLLGATAAALLAGEPPPDEAAGDVEMPPDAPVVTPVGPVFPADAPAEIAESDERADTADAPPAEPDAVETAETEEAIPGEAGPPRRLTPEEIRELPVLKRFEISLEKGKALLSDVKDETFGYGEPGFFWLVTVAAGLDAELWQADEEDLPYAQLLRMPEAWRGKPVTLRGVFASMESWRVPVVAIAKDIPRLVTVNIKEYPAGPNDLFAKVVVIEDPWGTFAPGDHVQVKGYFYKVLQYQDQEGDVHLAPLLVAKRLEFDTGGLQPFRGASQRSPVEIYLGLAFGALILLGVAFFLVRRLGRSKTDAKRGRIPHRIRLQRPGWAGPPAEGGPGGPEGGEDAQGDSHQ